jgi:UDP-N-acetylmuramoyl-L-alanyl-D-glutamate--2,6-diaminopimelate ligase
MTLGQLLENVPVSKMFQTTFGSMAVTHDVEIAGIRYDSSKIQQGDMFVALRGVKTDGHLFVTDAISRGAKAVVMEDDDAVPDPYFMHTGVVKIVVSNSRRALAKLSAAWYGNPAQSLRLIGVTGTNGKTTTAYVIRHLLEQSAPHARVGLIGTIEIIVGNEHLPATHTTPESLELHGVLSKMKEAGCTHVVMEVSSHALYQHRVFGLDFEAAVFTNLTQDHLDYHGTMDEYLNSKKVLFDTLSVNAVAAINADDPSALKMVRDSAARCVTYGFTPTAEIRAENTALSIAQTTYTLCAPSGSCNVQTPLVGKFNVSNALGAAAVCLSLGTSLEAIRDGLATFTAAPGRFDRVDSSKGWTAIIDYAHTPDALEKNLEALRDVMPENSGRLITVFGAGGDRDKSKRPLMGRIVEEKSDLTIVTSDNPRTEDPTAIIRDICAGLKHPEKAICEPDRGEAIRKACTMAASGDVMFIAGKGHENYQVIGSEKKHFSDKETVQKYL